MNWLRSHHGDSLTWENLENSFYDKYQHPDWRLKRLTTLLTGHQFTNLRDYNEKFVSSLLSLDIDPAKENASKVDVASIARALYKRHLPTELQNFLIQDDSSGISTSVADMIQRSYLWKTDSPMARPQDRMGKNAKTDTKAKLYCVHHGSNTSHSTADCKNPHGNILQIC